MENIEFPAGHIPVAVAARVLGVDQTTVRSIIISTSQKDDAIGIALRHGCPVTDVSEMGSKKGRINYYIFPAKFYEKTGYVWKGEKE